MVEEISINLEHVYALYDHCKNNKDINLKRISKGQIVFTYDWGNLGATYGIAFSVFLGIIAEEPDVIMPIDKCYLKQFPDKEEAREVKKNSLTLLLTRTMPHNRAHWIMREILQHCHCPRTPSILFNMPTQQHINAMIAEHSEFLAWAEKRNFFIYEGYDDDDDEDYNTYVKFTCVRNEWFPRVMGTTEASYANIDRYFSALDCNRYYMIQDVAIALIDHQMAIQEQEKLWLSMHQSLGDKLRTHGISVQEKAYVFLRTNDWQSSCWERTFKRSANVRNKKRIDRENNMLKYFEKDLAPLFYGRGLLNHDVFEKIAENWVARPTTQ
jgi:hypothetical protein